MTTKKLVSVLISEEEAATLHTVLGLVAGNKAAYNLFDKIGEHFNIDNDTFDTNVGKVVVTEENELVTISFKGELENGN